MWVIDLSITWAVTSPRRAPSHNITTAAFGGFAPLIAAVLIKVTGDQLSPRPYLIATATVTQIVRSRVRIIDLSLVWSSDITPVPGLPAIRMSPLHTHERDQRSNTLAEFSIHTGTHVDSPYHFVPDGTTVDALPLERFYGPATKMDLREIAEPGVAIGREALQRNGLRPDGAMSGRLLVLHTGWAAAHWSSEDFYTQNPYLSEDAARLIVDSAPLALAVDFSVDNGVPHPIHRILLRAGIPLIENLINLDQLPATFILCAAPVKVERGDGGPVRAFAVVEESREE